MAEAAAAAAAAQVSTIFGEGSAPPAGADQTPAPGGAGNQPPTGTNTTAAPAPDPTPTPGKPEWVPENFWRPDPADPTKGTVDAEAMAKSYNEFRGNDTRLRQQIAELTKTPEGVPEKPDEYWERMDWEALQQAAPNAYAGEAEQPYVQEMLKAAHTQGLPPEAARAMVTQFYTAINGDVAPATSPEEARKQAVGYLGPNGARMAADVRSMLTARAEKQQFGEKEVAALSRMVSDGPSLYVLWSILGSQVAPGGPPSVSNGQLQMGTEHERNAVHEMMRDDKNWNDPVKRAEMINRFNALPPDSKSMPNAGPPGGFSAAA